MNDTWFLPSFHPTESVEHPREHADVVDHLFSRSFVDAFIDHDPDALRVQQTSEGMSFINGSMLSVAGASPHLVFGFVLDPDGRAYRAISMTNVDVLVLVTEDNVASGIELLSMLIIGCGGEVHWIADVRPEPGIVTVTALSCCGVHECVVYDAVTEAVVDRSTIEHHQRPEDETPLVRRLWDTLALAHQLQGSTTEGYVQIFDKEDISWP